MYHAYVWPILMSTCSPQVARSNVVINLIGADRQTRNFSFDDTHVKITHRLAKIARESGVERFVQMSALGAEVTSKSAWLASKGNRGVSMCVDAYSHV